MRKNRLINWFHAELFWVIATSLLFIFSFSKALFKKSVMLAHDSIQWYGLYSYFIESIYNGSWPFWNPYTHAGEPFYYNYFNWPMLEPVTMLGIVIGKLFRLDIFNLYHWVFFLKLLFMYLGLYLFLRRLYKYLFTRLLLFVIIGLSSFSLVCLRVSGMLEVVYWLPWILLALLKVFEERANIFNWILLATFIGLSIRQYSIVYGYIFISIFLLVSCWQDKLILEKTLFIFKMRNLKLLLLFCAIIIALSAPFWSVILFDIGKIVPVARTLDGITKGFFLSLDEIARAEEYWKGAVNPLDIAGLVNPFFPYAKFRGWYRGYLGALSGYLSGALFYIGIIPLCLAVYGIVFSRHKYKLNFLILLMVSGGLMLGTKFIFLRIAVFLFPWLRFARHATHLFPLFMLALFYFTGLGLEGILERYAGLRLKLKRSGARTIFFSRRLVAKLFLLLSLLLAFTFKAKQVNLDIRYLVYFWGLCLFFILLLRRSLTVAKFGKLILTVFIVTDLSIYNYFNRPLMYLERSSPFPTTAQMSKLPERRTWDISDYSPILRFKSLLFRRHSIEKRFSTPLSPGFELKNFNALVTIPDNNLAAIAGVSEPIIRFYPKALAYQDEHFNQYFMNPKAEDILRKALFINDAETMGAEFLHSEDNLRDVTKTNNSFRYQVLSYHPSDIKLEVQSKNNGFLYFSDGYDNYWRGYIDQKPTNVYRANINFKAVLLPKGQHIVRFVYKPIYHIIALWLYLLTCCGVGLYLFWYLIIRKKVDNKYIFHGQHHFFC